MTIQEFIDKYREAFGEAAPLPIALDCHLRISQGISIYNHKDVRTDLYIQPGT